MVVLEFAKSNRAACRACPGNIEKDELKFGVAKNNDGYLNVEWYHQTCFWTKRASQYYKRKNKRVNILLKYDQFSGQQALDDQQRQELRDNIDKSNLRWGTKIALEKAGIEVPEAVPKVKPAVKTTKTKKPAEDETEVVQQSAVPEELPAKRRRVATVKYY